MTLWIRYASSAAASSFWALFSPSSALFFISAADSPSALGDYPATSFIAANTPLFIFQLSLVWFSASDFPCCSGSTPISSANRLAICFLHPAFLIYSACVQNCRTSGLASESHWRTHLETRTSRTRYHLCSRAIRKRAILFR